jgi:putative aldouronate transport system substrate-binding protein
MKKTHSFIPFILATSVAFSIGGCSQGNDAEVIQDRKAEADNTNLNQTGFPIVKEPVSMTVFGSRDPNQAPWRDILIFKEYEKLTNVKMDYQEVASQGFAERKNLLFASNELPDVFVRAAFTPLEIAMYGTTSKQLIPLDELIEKHAPNVRKLLEAYPEIRKELTAPDGHIYTLPTIRNTVTTRMGFKQWINKEWLSKLGLKAPTTPDEYVEVLKAFRDQDPNGNGKPDEIPLGLREPSSVYVTLAGSWGLENNMGYQINIENNKVNIWLTDERFKDYLQFLNKLYREKLLWVDYYKKDLPKWRSNLANETFGLFYMPFSDVFLSIENNYEGFAPIKGPKGDQKWIDYGTPVDTAGAFAISSLNKNPEVAVRWVDYFYSDEGSLFARYGIEGETYTKKTDGTPVIMDKIAKDSRGFMTALGEINLVPGGGFPHLMNEKTEGIVSSDKTKEAAKVLEPFLPKTIYPAPIFDRETSDRLMVLKQDIDKFKDETVTKFILGELSFDKWDEYVNTLKKIGIEELEKTYQKAFDTMNKK